MKNSSKGFFSDWKVHVLALVLTIIAEFIGIRPFRFPITETFAISFSLLPMLYVLIIGMALGGFKLFVDKEMMETASPYIGISVMWLTAKVSSSIGPNLKAVVAAGPALILQEFGNLGTIMVALPVAVLVFKMGRQAVGSSFSISREGSIAVVGSLYGLDSPEGQGVMGAYVTGTVLGTIFNSILVSLLIPMNIFHPYALAMACGTGSASMMTAALAPLVQAYPEMAEQLQSYAAASQVLSSADGLYMSLFIAIPFTNWLYKTLNGEQRHKEHEAKKAARRKG